MKTVIYIRTSTQEQNPANQLKACKSLNEWGEYQVFEDKQSAWKEHKERPAFEEIKKLIKNNKVSHLIVWDLDRLYRNMKRQKEFFELCKAYKVKVHSYRQQWLESIHKIPPPWNDIVHDLLSDIWGHIAEDESNKKSERVKLAVRRTKRGTLSYKGNRWGRKHLSTQKQNKILQLRKEGKSIRQIARELDVSSGAVHKYISII